MAAGFETMIFVYKIPRSRRSFTQGTGGRTQGHTLVGPG